MIEEFRSQVVRELSQMLCCRVAQGRQLINE